MVKIEKCYLVHVNLGGKPSSARIKEAASQIKALVTELSPDHQLAYTSGDGSTFGFFINSHLKSGQIIGRINTPGGDDTFRETRILPSPLRNDDSMLVLEIGEDVSALCSAKALAWLQHHHVKTNPNQATKYKAAAVEVPQQNQLASQLAEIKGKLAK